MGQGEALCKLAEAFLDASPRAFVRAYRSLADREEHHRHSQTARRMRELADEILAGTKQAMCNSATSEARSEARSEVSAMSATTSATSESVEAPKPKRPAPDLRTRWGRQWNGQRDDYVGQVDWYDALPPLPLDNEERPSEQYAQRLMQLNDARRRIGLGELREGAECAREGCGAECEAGEVYCSRECRRKA